jgi:hypothetical protein
MRSVLPLLFPIHRDDEDAKRLEILARKFNRPVSDMKCEGCRSANVSFYCKTCLFKNCAENRGIDFCGECAEYPCEKLVEFRKQAPHRAQLWESQEILKKEGFEKWFENRKRYHSCSSCNTVNSVYDPVCRNCGKSPLLHFLKKTGKS